MNDKLKPAELELLWLTGAPAEVEAPVLLTAEEMLVMTGVGIPVAVRLADVLDNEDDVLSGPAEPADRPVEPYETMVTLAKPEDELPDDEAEVVNWCPDEDEPAALVLLPVRADEEDVDKLTD